MGAAGSSTSTSHALQNCLRLPQACPPDRVARLCAALRDVGMPPTGVQVSAHGDLILFEPIPHTTISTTTPTPGLVAGVQAVRPPAQQPGRQPGRQLGSTAAVTAPDSAREMGAAAPGARAASTASGALEPFLAPSLPPSVDGGVTFKYDGYIRTGHTMAVLAWTQLCTCTQHLACASHALVRWAACVAHRTKVTPRYVHTPTRVGTTSSCLTASVSTPRKTGAAILLSMDFYLVFTMAITITMAIHTHQGHVGGRRRPICGPQSVLRPDGPARDQRGGAALVL